MIKRCNCMAVILLTAIFILLCGCTGQNETAEEEQMEVISCTEAAIKPKAAEEEEKETPIRDKKGGFRVYGNVNKAIVEAADNQLEMLPDNVWERFCKEGWELVITSDELPYYGETYVDAVVMGSCDSGTKRIELSSVSTAYIQSSLLHEFGHFVYKQQNKDMRSVFRVIYEYDMKNGIPEGYSSHCTSDAGEYFAESFKRYLRDQDVTEQAGAYIESALKKIN